MAFQELNHLAFPQTSYAILYKNDLQDIICIVLSLQMINSWCSLFVIQGTYCSFVRNEMVFVNCNGNVLLLIVL